MNFFYLITGACLASFTTLCAYRLPRHISVIVPRSKCDHCCQVLRWWQLIPVIGFVIQRGRCYDCHKKISPASTINEVILGWVAFHLAPLSPTVSISYLVVFISLIALATMDLHYQFIYPALFLGLLPAFYTLPRQNYFSWLFWLGIGATALVLSFITFTTHGLGLADTEMILLIELLLGFYLTNMIVMFSCLGAIVFAVIKHQRSRFAFLPFICGSFAIYLFIHLHWI